MTTPDIERPEPDDVENPEPAPEPEAPATGCLCVNCRRAMVYAKVVDWNPEAE